MYLNTYKHKNITNKLVSQELSLAESSASDYHLGFHRNLQRFWQKNLPLVNLYKLCRFVPNLQTDGAA